MFIRPHAVPGFGAKITSHISMMSTNSQTQICRQRIQHLSASLSSEKNNSFRGFNTVRYIIPPVCAALQSRPSLKY
ncbi:uncharacterized [Tachysurus ichikawai]